jgi:arylsulfatase
MSKDLKRIDPNGIESTTIARGRFDRRGFLRWLGGSAAACALPGFAQSASETGTPKRPNIIVIMCDDFGFSDLGCYGSEIQTPNLDRLGFGGVRFTQFYNTARCCPSRAALLTGLYQHQAGIGHMVGNKGVPSYQGYLNDRCVTVAEAIRAGGYTPLMTGKWHVGEARPHWPLDRGFEHYWGLISGACNYYQLDPGRQMAEDNEPWTPPAEGFYMTDEISTRAAKMIDEYGRRPDPFFLYVAYTAPHWPLHALPEDIAKYRGKYLCGWDELRQRRHKRMIELGIVDPTWPLSPRDPDVGAWEDEKNKQWQDSRMATYAAQVDRVDQGVGRILSKIKQLGQEENTLILFLADNGGCHENQRDNKPEITPGPRDTFASYGRCWANASNTPLRMFKTWVHEGGIASPLIAYWPGRIKAGRITHQVGHIIDIMPTCLDAAAVQYPKEYKGRAITPVEGKSLLPVFEGKAREGHAAIFWEHQGNRAVRQGKWKLVAKNEAKWELYDLETDRTELHDLASQMPQKVKELEALYDNWAGRAGVVPWKELNAKNAKPAAEKAANPKKKAAKKAVNNP